jgi:adenosine deaminase
VRSAFQAALENRDLDALPACEKADLHLHAGVGSGDRAFLKARTGLDIAPVDRVLVSMDDMHAWVRDRAGERFHLGRVASIEDHPIRRLFDAGIRVTVGTDDPLMFGTSLSEEFLALYDASVLTAAELDVVRLEALRGPW